MTSAKKRMSLASQFFLPYSTRYTAPSTPRGMETAEAIPTMRAVPTRPFKKPPLTLRSLKGSECVRNSKFMYRKPLATM